MTAMIWLLATTFMLTFLIAIVSEEPHRSRAGTWLAVVSLVLLTGITVASWAVDL